MSDTDNQSTQEQQEQGQEPKTVADLPQWAQDQLKEANAEAAKYRVEKKDAVEAAKKAAEDEWTKKLDDALTEAGSAKSELESKLAEADRRYEKLVAVLDPDVSARALKVAELVKGDNPDEIRSHANELRELFGQEPKTPPPAVDPSQGQGSTLPLNGDPVLNEVLSLINK